jgi:hypothetical protein
MKEISQATALVYDHGLFLPIAHRLAEKFKRVLYFTPCEEAFATLDKHIVGDGYDNIEKCQDLWKVKNEVDCFVFPDIQHSGLQLELESQGFAVWGSRNGDSLEINRQKFNRVLKEVGLPVAKHVVIKGLTDLRSHLRDLTDRYIKVSKYRGTCETFHWRDNDLDSGWLDAMAVKLGPAQDLLPFLVFEPIDAPVEIGGDTYCVDGQWPSLMLHGDEEKDRCYFGAVTPFEKMPEELKAIMEAFSPVLKKERYRNQWSMETRDGKFIDATCRGGLPSTGSQLSTWSNFPEIVYHGAHGELVEPIPAHQFSVECILSLKSKPHEWGKTRIRKELVGHAQFAACCEIDGAICFPPDGHSGDDVGWLVAGGDTMEEAIAEIIRLSDLLPDGLDAATMDLIGLIEKIKAGEKEGADFGEEKVPEPATVIDA